MDEEEFRRLLGRLADTDLAALGRGFPLRLVDDERLAWGRGGEPDVIVAVLPNGADARPRAWLDARAEVLLADYYRTHPLTRNGFDRQVSALFSCHGAGAFAAPPGGAPAYTLFVDGGVVVAEGRGCPRHRYGACCTLSTGPTAAAPAKQALDWLARGGAYEQYLAMNVCRYNC